MQDAEWLSVRTAEIKIENILKEYTEKYVKKEYLENACEEFLTSSNSAINLDTDGPYFKSWLYYSCIIHFEATKEYYTIAEKCFEDFPELFSSYEAKILNAIIYAPFSFYLVFKVVKGKSLLIRDIFTQKELLVKEFLASKSLEKALIIFCRPITLNVQSIFVGMANCTIPNRFF